MMETHITKTQVLRLFENNGFDYDEETNEVVYEDEQGTKRAFPLPWLSKDETMLYSLGSVRKQMGKMMETVKLGQQVMDAANDKAFMDEVAAGLRAFGMAYDEENDLFVYHEPGVLAFTVTLHSLVSTVVHDREKLEKLAKRNKADAQSDKLPTKDVAITTKDLVMTALDAMKVDAQESKKEMENNGKPTEKEQDA